MAIDGLSPQGSSIALSCPACGSEVSPNLLSCPSCQRLVHAERLKELAEQADVAELKGDLSSAMGAWRDALSLLPTESRQHTVVAGRVNRLARLVESGP